MSRESRGQLQSEAQSIELVDAEVAAQVYWCELLHQTVLVETPVMIVLLVRLLKAITSHRHLVTGHNDSIYIISLQSTRQVSSHSDDY